MKKILSITILLIFVMSNYILGCNFHSMLPTGEGSDFVDTLYIEYDTKTPEHMVFDKEYIKTYIYVIQMEEYIWIENVVSKSPGLYVFSSNDIKSIEQDSEKLDYINITMKDGTVTSINTIDQANDKNNVFEVVEVNSITYLDLKEGYEYIYEEEELVDESVNSDNPIQRIKEFSENRTQEELKEASDIEINYNNNDTSIEKERLFVIFASISILVIIGVGIKIGSKV